MVEKLSMKRGAVYPFVLHMNTVETGPNMKMVLTARVVTIDQVIYKDANDFYLTFITKILPELINQILTILLYS